MVGMNVVKTLESLSIKMSNNLWICVHCNNLNFKVHFGEHHDNNSLYYIGKCKRYTFRNFQQIALRIKGTRA